MPLEFMTTQRMGTIKLLLFQWYTCIYGQSVAYVVADYVIKEWEYY